MKHLLEKLRKEHADCETEHDEVKGILDLHAHDDVAIVGIWKVLSANTELLQALAEVMLEHIESHHCPTAKDVGYKNL